jgi:hypothetical protein
MPSIVEQVRDAIQAQVIISAHIPGKYLKGAARAAIRALWEPTDEMVAQAITLIAATEVTLTETGKRRALGELIQDEGQLSAVFRNGWRGAIHAALR